MVRSFILPALLGAAMAATPAGARSSVSQDSHDALAARLVAVLPPSGEEAKAPDAFAIERAAELTKRYPAKSAQIAAGFAERTVCSNARSQEVVGRMLRAVAQSLSDDDLRGMIAFYTGPDLGASEKIAEGTPEWKALTARYPLVRFGEAMKAQVGESFFKDVFDAETACDAVLTAALAKEGIAE